MALESQSILASQWLSGPANPPGVGGQSQDNGQQTQPELSTQTGDEVSQQRDGPAH